MPGANHPSGGISAPDAKLAPGPAHQTDNHPPDRRPTGHRSTQHQPNDFRLTNRDPIRHRQIGPGRAERRPNHRGPRS
jgi:hypothetical protein